MEVCGYIQGVARETMNFKERTLSVLIIIKDNEICLLDFRYTAINLEKFLHIFHKV